VVDGEIQPEDFNYFMNTGKFTTEQMGGLCEACGWLRLLNMEGWWSMYLDMTKREALEVVAKLLSEKQLCGMKVTNGVGLYRKVNAWRDWGRDSLISKKHDNDNAVKGGESRKIMVGRILDLAASGHKASVQKIHDIYVSEAKERGWEILTRQRIDQLLRIPENEMLIYGHRHGVNAMREKFEPILKGKATEYADCIWSWDGTTVQLYMDEAGKITKPYYRVSVTDAFSGAIIGEAFGETETAEVCIEALRMAVDFGGYLPKVIQMDGAIARMKKVQKVLTSLSVLGIRAQPYNGKSKFVERVLGRKEQAVMRFYGNFVGGNATGKSLQAKANPDMIKRLKKDGGLPQDKQTVIYQDLLATVIYNNKLIKKHGQTPLERYAELDDRRVRANDNVIAMAFWTVTQDTIQYNAKGIAMRLGDDTFEYVVESEKGVQCPDFYTNHCGQNFYVRFHVEDMSKVMLFTEDDRYVATANQKYEYSRIPLKGEGAMVRQALDNRSKLIKEKVAEMKAISDDVRGAGLPELDFSLAHKDEINRAGLGIELDRVDQMGVDSGKKYIGRRAALGAAQAATDSESILEVDDDFIKGLLD
jgi:hypothetical protein